MGETRDDLSRDALLRAIDADPGNNQLRLAFADWLDAEGGAQNLRRAALIRVQCRPVRPEPPAPDSARREADLETAVRSDVLGLLAEPTALVDRALELRRVSPGFAGDMLAALHPPDVRVKAVFRRGFLAELTLDAAFFVLAADELVRMLPRPSITVLGAAAYLRAFFECEQRWLASAIQMQTVGDRFRVAFDQRWIRSAFAGPTLWARLESLDLSSCSLGNGEARSVIDSAQLPVLARLNFARNHLDGHLLRYLVQTPRWRALDFLSWSGNACGDVGADALLLAEDAGRPREIELVACRIGPERQQRLIAKYGTRVRFAERPVAD